MSVVIETTLGDITVDLFIKNRPRACMNFLKLCKMKYYNFSLFHTVSRGFIAQTGDPTGSRRGGESIFGVLEGPSKRYFEPETNPRIKHTIMGLISFVGNNEGMIGSQFFFTLGTDLTYLDDKHCVFGEVVEGVDVLEIVNEAICDKEDRPYQDIRITHTVILEDPFPDLHAMHVPNRSPSPSAERLQGGRIAPDEEIDETVGKTVAEIQEMTADREAKARATILEMVGDIPDAEIAPPENVLFVCKLNPVTNDDDLEIIFSRFGKIKSCEVIRDRKTGDSLQYAFVEFGDKKACEDAYFKMDNVLIDDRRIHVDFSQSVSKIRWLGKGRGLKNYGARDKDLGKGHYQKGEPGKESIKDGKRNNDKEWKKNDNKRTEIDRRRDPERHRDRDRRDRRDRKLEYEKKDKYDDRYRDDRRTDRYRSDPKIHERSGRKHELPKGTKSRKEGRKKRDKSSSDSDRSSRKRKSRNQSSMKKRNHKDESGDLERDSQTRRKKKSRRKYSSSTDDSSDS